MNDSVERPVGLDSPDEVVERVLRNSAVFFEGENRRALSSRNVIAAAILASQDGLRAVREMDAAGHRPMVYLEEEKHFYVGTGRTLPPDSSLGSAYNAAAGAEVDIGNERLPDGRKVKWQGAAVERVAAMGAQLMPGDHWARVNLLRFYDPHDRGLESGASARWSFLDSTRYLPKLGVDMPSVVMTALREPTGITRLLVQTPLLAGPEVGFHCYRAVKK